MTRGGRKRRRSTAAIESAIDDPLTDLPAPTAKKPRLAVQKEPTATHKEKQVRFCHDEASENSDFESLPSDSKAKGANTLYTSEEKGEEVGNEKWAV